MSAPNLSESADLGDSTVSPVNEEVMHQVDETVVPLVGENERKRQKKKRLQRFGKMLLKCWKMV